VIGRAVEQRVLAAFRSATAAELGLDTLQDRLAAEQQATRSVLRRRRWSVHGAGLEGQAEATAA
jgi:hypothetical protein